MIFVGVMIENCSCVAKKQRFYEKGQGGYILDTTNDIIVSKQAGKNCSIFRDW